MLFRVFFHKRASNDSEGELKTDKSRGSMSERSEDVVARGKAGIWLYVWLAISEVTSPAKKWSGRLNPYRCGVEQWSACKAHNLEVGGSNPSPATILLHVTL